MHFSKPILDFIREYREEDPAKIALKSKNHPDWPMPWIASQVAGWQVAKSKVPTWAEVPTLCYPNKLPLEQCSSELTARFKASLFEGGKRLADLTGGWGVDTYFLAEKFEMAYHIEAQRELHEVAKYNFEQLKATHIQPIHGDASKTLAELPPIDLIYIDPARRDAQQRKVFELSHCEPNILHLLPQLLKKGKSVLLKASPMVDIPQAIRLLEQVRQVWVVAVKGECKEVLFELQKGEGQSPKVSAVNLGVGAEAVVYNHLQQEKDLAPPLSEPLSYLYEPHAGIMKAGLFSTTAHRFQTKKLHRHTHLYTSEKLVENFPGRKFAIKEVLPYNKKTLKRRLPSKANLTVRNFPQSVAKMRQHLGLKEGGDDYLFATTLSNGSRVMIWTRPISDGVGSD